MGHTNTIQPRWMPCLHPVQVEVSHEPIGDESGHAPLRFQAQRNVFAKTAEPEPSSPLLYQTTEQNRSCDRNINAYLVDWFHCGAINFYLFLSFRAYGILKDSAQRETLNSARRRPRNDVAAMRNTNGYSKKNQSIISK